MNLMLFGAPGAGKGTQAKFLIEKYNIPQISTGDILRAAIADKTDMGMEAKKFMDEGKLVPDSTIIGIIKDRLAEADCKNGFILDGFPRTLAQAEALSELMNNMGISLDKVISLNVPDELIVGRITGRRVCSKCGASFHVEFNPSKEENVCDYCGGDRHCDYWTITVLSDPCCHRCLTTATRTADQHVRRTLTCEVHVNMHCRYQRTLELMLTNEGFIHGFHVFS
jgi:adenylate kinase